MDDFAVIQALLQWIKPRTYRACNAWNRGSVPGVSSLAPRILAQAMYCAHRPRGNKESKDRAKGRTQDLNNTRVGFYYFATAMVSLDTGRMHINPFPSQSLQMSNK